jgi:hypothetical protein
VDWTWFRFVAFIYHKNLREEILLCSMVEYNRELGESKGLTSHEETGFQRREDPINSYLRGTFPLSLLLLHHLPSLIKGLQIFL